MWILKADAKPGDRPIALGHKISEGVAISRRSMTIAWSNTRGQYPDLLQQGESVIYTATIVFDGAQPRLAVIIRSVRGALSLAAVAVLAVQHHAHFVRQGQVETNFLLRGLQTICARAMLCDAPVLEPHPV